MIALIGRTIIHWNRYNLLGKVLIVNDVKIGVNAVVTIDVPDNSTVVRVPQEW